MRTVGKHFGKNLHIPQNGTYSLLNFRKIRITAEGAWALISVTHSMVRVCCVPNSSSRSNREQTLSYYGLPLTNKKLLKQWIHRIGRKNLPLNKSTVVCSRHFVGTESQKRLLRPDEVPSKELPVLPTTITCRTTRKPPRERPPLTSTRVTADNEKTPPREHRTEIRVYCDKGMQTDVDYVSLLKELTEKIEMLEDELRMVKSSLEKQRFRLANIASNDKIVAFYTGFPSYSLLESCFNFLGPAAHQLSYNARDDANCENPLQIGGRPHVLPPSEEFFLY